MDGRGGVGGCGWEGGVSWDCERGEKLKLVGRDVMHDSYAKCVCIILSIRRVPYIYTILYIIDVFFVVLLFICRFLESSTYT